MTPIGAPTDPAYLRFLEGLSQVASSLDSVRRWHGRAQEWRFFDSAGWIIDESNQIADTSPSLVLQEKWNPHRFEVLTLSVPELFTRIQAAQSQIISRYPKMEHPVWTPLGGGDWRSAIQRGGPSPGKVDEKKLPAEALRRIALVREFVAKEIITPQVGNEIIASIVREYTD